ncbi:hypothetical protein DO97_17145 [Neosynechococcus sphagnicola sy1]|uniref:Uncharacterized protein n=1 Tax=Neosynechococcus sphagnicola sy1 TaxID=1497020 RepID=A0A098THY3_9CYAN|nr:hypothetical protein [Neosynechococcus sphagnicola]KGF71626.1 hypothetical protein DO97_17145 [Neosynechococcus sphagnicola sy1]
MDIQERLSRQRVHYIVSSYQLAGDETAAFEDYLEDLISTYPLPLIELALTETLVHHWLQLPLLRGIGFLVPVHQRLKFWQGHPITSTLTPEQFQQITGLDPQPIFGSYQRSPTTAYP